MSCGKSTADVQAHLATTSNSDTYHWFTPWMVSIGIETLKAVIAAHGASGQLRCQLAIQVAGTRTEDPGAPVKLDAALDGDGERCTGLESIAQYTGDTFYVRFGVAYSVQPNQSGLAQADVTFSVSFTQCGKLVGGKTLSLASTTSTPAYAVVTPMVSALMVQKVKALVVASSLNGNFGWKLCYRTATTNKDNPSGWTSLEAGDPHGTGPFCLGEFTVSLDGEMWVQFGVMYQSSSGAGDAQVMVSYAVRRS